MTSKLLFAVLIALGSVPWLSLQETQVPDAQTLQKMAARFAPTEISADLSQLSRRGPPGAREARRGVEDRRRPVPAPGVGRQ